MVSQAPSARLSWVAGSSSLAAPLLALFDGPRREPWLIVAAVLLFLFGIAGLVLRYRISRVRKPPTDQPPGALDPRGFVTRLDRRDRRRPSVIAVFDIDEFRAINEVLGHASGDRALTAIAERLAHAVRDVDGVGHLGADRFAVHLVDIGDETVAAEIVGRLLASLAEPLEIGALDVELTASVGIAMAGSGLAGATALQRATVAAEAAKSGATTVEFFRPEHESHSEASMAMVAQVRRGLAAGELQPYYQPVIDTVSGRTIGFEALVRWIHPNRGVIPPALFLEQIEHLPVGRAFTDHLLDRSLAGLRHLDSSDLFVSVNLSLRDVEDPNLPPTVAALLERHRITPGRLVLEVAAPVGRRSRERAQQVLGQLGDLGCGIAIDDFGGTPVPVEFIASVPITEIKIDRRFVDCAGEDPVARAVIRQCVGLGHGTGLRVTAKGVEREATLEQLIALECDQAQGFHFAEPMPVAEVVAWIADERLFV